ncbi:MAG: hypothetical protein ACRDNP_14260, partial [Gaiellaceae bacterium]
QVVRHDLRDYGLQDSPVLGTIPVAATVANDVVFTATFNGKVYGLDTRGGSVLWYTQAPAGVKCLPGDRRRHAPRGRGRAGAVRKAPVGPARRLLTSLRRRLSPGTRRRPAAAAGLPPFSRVSGESSGASFDRRMPRRCPTCFRRRMSGFDVDPVP